MTAQVDVDEDRVVLQGIECREADVVAFFGDAAPETRVELAHRAVAIGVAGLRAMGVAGHVEVVERELAKLSHQFDRALATTEGQLLERVHSTFDPDRAEYVEHYNAHRPHRYLRQRAPSALGTAPALVSDVDATGDEEPITWAASSAHTGWSPELGGRYSRHPQGILVSDAEERFVQACSRGWQVQDWRAVVPSQ